MYIMITILHVYFSICSLHQTDPKTDFHKVIDIRHKPPFTSALHTSHSVQDSSRTRVALRGVFDIREALVASARILWPTYKNTWVERLKSKDTQIIEG